MTNWIKATTKYLNLRKKGKLADSRKTMSNTGKTVFISYRRSASIDAAENIYRSLCQKRCDVFIDIKCIHSGDFAKRIYREIAQRSNFIIIFSKGTADRFSEPGDFLRKEIECAIKQNRNVIPVVMSNCDIVEIKNRLNGKIRTLLKRHIVTVPEGYFDAAMKELYKGLM